MSADLEKSGSESPPNEKHENNGANGGGGALDKHDTDQHIPWTFTRCVAIASLCGVYVGAQEILYFTSGALTYIGPDLGTAIPNWLLTANTLAVTAICPFVGYLTDLLGRKWICTLGGIFLIISSAVMGTAHSLAVGLVAQTFGGLGAGICELTALAGVAEITPVRWRGVTLAIVTFSIVPFMPYLIYIIECQQASTWRWVFLIAGLWNVLSFIGIVFCYKPPPKHNVDGLTKMQIAAKIDYGGAFLSIGGVTLFLVGLQSAGYPYSASDGKVLGPLIVGILMIIAFPIYEWKVPKNPMVPGAIFKGQHVVTLAYIIVFVAGMNFYGVLGFFPVMLQYLYPYDPLRVGVRALCYPIAILGGACIVSFLMSYTRGHVRQMFFICSAMMAAGCGALAAATPFNPALAIAMATIASFGIGGIVVPSLTLALYACPDRYIGTTGALSLTVRFLGGSIGTAIYFNIFNNKEHTLVPQYIGEYAVKAGLDPQYAMEWVVDFLGSVMADPTGAGLVNVPHFTPQIAEASGIGLRWGFADSLSYVWYTTIAFSVLSCIAAAFIPNIRTYMTNRVAVDIH